MADRVYANLQKTDGHGRLLLTTVGTKRDIEAQGIKLREGLHLSFYSDDMHARGNRDDLVYEGTAHYDDENRAWVAEIDRGAIKHESELQD